MPQFPNHWLDLPDKQPTRRKEFDEFRREISKKARRKTREVKEESTNGRMRGKQPRYRWIYSAKLADEKRRNNWSSDVPQR
jgi:hypothetical protein